MGVVETYPQHAFPEHNSYGKEQQQAGKADPARYPRGNDAGEQRHTPGKQRHVQLVQGHVNLVRRHGFWSLELCQLISTDFSECDSSDWSKRKTMRIAIAGAGAVGRSVADELVTIGHKVLLIEREWTRYGPSAVPDADWLLADACELTSLQEAELQICDVVIAATGDDKSNLTVSLLAKTEFAVDRVVARVNEFPQRMAVH